MAIIRIKRTTGTSLPTGLTFGEMAYVQGSGATANRLYISDNAGVCVWVGAQILQSPTFWSGITANTTLATVGAIEDRIVRGGGVTFSGPITVNIAEGKFFGKYKKNDIIPATGQTVKWVIEDALSERIGATLAMSASPSSISYGQTSGSITVTVSYTIKTAGASAAGSTLEFQYAGAGAWTSLSTSLFNSNQQDVPYTTTFTHNTWNTATDANSGGTYGSAGFVYRWSVTDTAGATAILSQTLVSRGTAVSPTVTYSSLAANSVRTGNQTVTGAGAETNTYREKGNTFTTVNMTINRSLSSFVPLTGYTLQAAEFAGNSYGPWITIKRELISGNPSSFTPSPALTYAPQTLSTNLDRLKFRVRISDLARDQLGSGPLDLESSQIFFDYMIFFGGTANTSINGAMIRGLSGAIVAGNPSGSPGSGGGANGGAGAIANPITNSMYSSNTQAATGPNSNLRFIIAVPDSVSVTKVLDSFASNADVTAQFPISTTVTSVNDRNGDAKDYNVYVLSTTGYADGPHYHEITRSGSVTKP